MKKFFLVCLTLSILFFLPFVIRAVQGQPRVVRVGAFNYYPAIFKDADGSIKGFLVDTLAEVAQRENIRFEYVYGSFSEGLERIKSGEVDVLTSVAYTAERATYLDYSQNPLLNVWGELYVPLKSEIDGIKDLQGKKVAVMKGDFNAVGFMDLAKKFSINCQYVELSGFEAVFKAISTKQVDAGVVSSVFGVPKQKEYGLRPTGVVFNPFDIFFTVARGKNQDLLALLDGYLDKWRHQKDSVYNTARQKWSHVSNGTLHVIPRWVISATVALAGLVLAALVFIVLLKRQVYRKTRMVVESAKQYQVLSARQSAILAAVTDIIIEVDTNKIITWSNNAGREFFGEDLIGRDAKFYFEGEQNTYELVQPLFEGKENVLYVESWQRRKNGEVRLLAWWCKALEDEQGGITGTLSTARDITDSKQTEEELAEKERLLRESQKVAHIGSYSTDLITRTWKASLEIHQIFGIDETYPHTLEGWAGFIHPDSREKLFEYHLQVEAEKKRFDHEYKIIRINDRAERWVHGFGELEFDNQANPVRMIGTIQDITERKRLEEAQNFIFQCGLRHTGEDFFESLAKFLAQGLEMDYVCIDSLHGDGLNAQTVAIYYDGEFQDNVEYALKDTPCGDVVGNTICCFQQDVRSMFPQDVALQEMLAESYVGTTLWSFDGKPIGLIAVIGRQPLKDSRLAEDVLKLVAVRAAGELERKRTEKDLLDKNRELERFTYTVSHDLKSPLITIQSYAGMIKHDMDAGNHERARGDIKRIEDAASKMTTLLNDLLELSRVGRQMNAPSLIDMNRLVKDTLGQLAGPLGQRELEVIISQDLPAVHGDHKRIAEALQNLVENAIKYMGDQSSPCIEIGWRQDGIQVVFFVGDNGQGIDPLHHEEIFGLFNKLDAKSEGTGVGLALVKRIIELHGGRVWVESEGTRQGSTFCFTLPAHA